MEIYDYFIDIDKAVQTINKNQYRTIALQIPEGLRRSVWDIIDYLKKQTKAEFIVIADPCFGACDIASCEIKNLGVEFIIQIGHTKIPNIDDYFIPTIFINALFTKDVSKVVEKSISYLEGENIGIVTTAQHLNAIKDVSDILKSHNLKPVLSDGDDRISDKGQILGCNFSAGLNIVDKVDCFLFIGSGSFHPIGLLLSSKKPVIAADPFTKFVKKQELNDLKDTILRQRYGAIANSKNARRYGILVGMKSGQQRIKLAYEIKKLLDSFNKKSAIISLNHFTPSYLQGFGNIDCYVSTACPRIAIDDYLTYKKPILTPVELEISLGVKEWEDYEFDQIF